MMLNFIQTKTKMILNTVMSLQPTHQRPVDQSPYCWIMVCYSAVLMCPLNS